MSKRTTNVSEYQLTLKVTPQKSGGYVATCPEWSACYAQGETVEEAVLEATAVAQALIELYKEEDQKIPLKLVKQQAIKSPLAIPVIVSG